MKKRLIEVTIVFVMFVFNSNFVNAQQKELSENRIPLLNEMTQKWGYVDTSGTLVIPFIYTHAERFNEGFAFVSKSKSFVYTRWEVINLMGDTIPLPETYEFIDMFQNKLFVFASNTTIYDQSGAIKKNKDKYLNNYRKYIFVHQNEYRFRDHPLLF